jgi:hypothetical protein
MRALIQKSQQLGPYNISCEARLALGELGMELNSSWLLPISWHSNFSADLKARP